MITALLTGMILFGAIASVTCWAGMAFRLDPDGLARVPYYLGMVGLVVCAVGAALAILYS